ncbi:hypothetical protein N7520_009036 [Penicillium odoratum]|uniref:uncharacterized protein n=1 Tax=Penicillium odoratum TaxID=1167516 RepID=UPI0025472D33|nr:uncharacterized protein N7520_009036 [Penicillium odoratum]KAJ5752119.1 hypothetical protein N7520_009036 [Penicillium odoratum]
MDVGQLPDFKVLSEEYNYNEKTTQESISLKTSSSWTYCGPLLSLDPNHLPSSFKPWADATINGSILHPLLSFLEFVHSFLSTNNLSHYWITIRADTGSHNFDIPRWHTDDLFFSPTPTHRHRRRSSALFPRIRAIAPRNKSEDLTHLLEDFPSAQITTKTPNPTNWKLTTTLLGPGTLFINEGTTPLAREIQRRIKHSVGAENPHICASVRCLGCATAAESVRSRLAVELGDHEVVQVQSGDYVFFRVGRDTGAVHSEPMSNGDRIFVNVVPGDEGDLKSLLARWGMEYPRAWCVGLPFQMAGVHWSVGGI